MNWLIKQATIIDPSSAFHLQETDLLIRDGRIGAIGKKLSAGEARVIQAKGAFLSPGWLDVGVQTGDPGYEHREDLNTVTAAAAAGGYTGILCQPNTDPVIHSKSEVRYLIDNTRDKLVTCLPIGAISRNCEGRDITEMLDMQAAGAVAFSDGEKPVQHNGLMLRALLYVKAFGGLVINQANDHTIAGSGQIHEGVVSTSLGMKGIPALAEEMMVQRDLYLLEYTNSRLHLANISTAGTVELVRRAKARGLRVTASVPALNLLFDDTALEDFDPNYKVLPPLRSSGDREALLAGLGDGTIDFITSNHVPREEEAKKKEFAYAEYGAVGLETTFAALNTGLGDRFSPEQWARWLSVRPREVLGLEIPLIAEGQAANLTLFSTGESWTVEAAKLRSRSKNSPFLGRELKGKVWAVFNRGQSEIFIRL